MTGQPPLRPGVGFCVQTESAGSSATTRWYLNMCKHRIVDMPIAFSGRPVDREWILTHGIANLQVPFDAGTFRKLKMRAEGAKQTTYAIDVVFNPVIIQCFMDDEFNKTMEQFRPFVINLALKRIEESVGVKLSKEKVKLVKSLRYKDGEDDDEGVPREFQELAGSEDCFDAEAPKKPTPKAEDTDASPLIEDLTPGKKSKTAIKKGFFNKKGGASLYGDEGSKEGVLPENAGDPMGWMPKGLRNTCKIVDTNDPEYQKNEQARVQAEEKNSSAKEFNNELTKNMEKWAKLNQPEKWQEDLPDGTEEPELVKYSNDYSRFKDIPDVDDGPNAEERDWYCDPGGNVQWRGQAKAKASTAPAAAAAPAEQGPAIKKGFLDGAKPLYPKGSENAKAVKEKMSEQQMMQDLAGMLGKDGSMDMSAMEKLLGGEPGEMAAMKEMLSKSGGDFGDMAAMEKMMGKDGADMAKALQSLSAAATSGEPGGAPKTKVQAKAAALKVPEFTLTEVAEGLQLAVDVPGLTSMQGVNLDVTERKAALQFPGSVGLKPLEVDLPSAVRPNEVRAKFSKKTQRITVTLPGASH